MTDADRFQFLNETHSLAEVGWDDASLDKLWRYNLHYFDDLTASGSGDQGAGQAALLRRWVRENQPGRGTAWEPYPTSLRIVNWVKWSLAGNALPPECVQSLAVQARWLTRRLEWHLLGNHLLSNGKALLFAASLFDGPEADGWADRGLGILSREVPEQILADGAHFERSPMYHALALEDLLDLCNLGATCPRVVERGGVSPVTAWRSRAESMWRWATAMTHPDGEIAFFNDAAMGVAPTLAVLDGYCRRLRLETPEVAMPGVTALEASGYIRVESGAMVALLDVGLIGPDYLPAHAHADSLSFELSLLGKRLFVNSGTSCYASGAERSRQRGTAAHNTVVVDDEDSSEVWDSFRVARRARPMELSVQSGVNVVVQCAHDGYRRLPGKPVPSRKWTFGPASMTIEDRIEGPFGHAEARYHLHPRVEIESQGPAAGVAQDAVRLRIAGERTVLFTAEAGRLAIEPATWHPEFGRTERTHCLVVRFEEAMVRTRLAWEGEE